MKGNALSEGVMFLEISSGSGFAPVVGVEPFVYVVGFLGAGDGTRTRDVQLGNMSVDCK
jgi:hypothetical protein